MSAFLSTFLSTFRRPKPLWDMVGNMVVDKVADMEVATISNGVATITNEPAVGLLWNLNPD